MDTVLGGDEDPSHLLVEALFCHATLVLGWDRECVLGYLHDYLIVVTLAIPMLKIHGLHRFNFEEILFFFIVLSNFYLIFGFNFVFVMII